MKVTISTIKYNQFTIFSENRKYNFLRWEIVVLQRYFYLRKTTYSSVCVFERLLFPVVSSLLIPLGKSACYFFPLKVLFLKKQEDFLECWVSILKIVSLLGSYTSNGEKLQNRVWTQSCREQLVQKLAKFPVLKRIFVVEKKVSFQGFQGFQMQVF